MLRRWVERWLGIAVLRQNSSELLQRCDALTSKTEQLQRELADLRAIITTRPKLERPPQARTWSQVKHTLAELEERGMYAEG